MPFLLQDITQILSVYAKQLFSEIAVITVAADNQFNTQLNILRSDVFFSY